MFTRFFHTFFFHTRRSFTKSFTRLLQCVSHGFHNDFYIVCAMFACEAFTIFALLRFHRILQCFDKASTRLLQGAHNVFTMCFTMLLQVRDSLPEWSRVVDSSSTSACCVGSNPTAVMLLQGFQKVSTSLFFF